jgi:hypothetical protein
MSRVVVYPAQRFPASLPATSISFTMKHSPPWWRKTSRWLLDRCRQHHRCMQHLRSSLVLSSFSMFSRRTVWSKQQSSLEQHRWYRYIYNASFLPFLSFILNSFSLPFIFLPPLFPSSFLPFLSFILNSFSLPFIFLPFIFLSLSLSIIRFSISLLFSHFLSLFHPLFCSFYLFCFVKKGTEKEDCSTTVVGRTCDRRHSSGSDRPCSG